MSAAAAPARALPRSVAARTLNLLPPTVVTGAVRVIEFLLVAALGFAIYLGYVESEGQSAHLSYFAAVVTAAVANTLMLQAFDLYSVPAFSAFVRSFARIGLAWTLVMAGLMAGAFFGKVSACGSSPGTPPRCLPCSARGWHCRFWSGAGSGRAGSIAAP